MPDLSNWQPADTASADAQQHFLDAEGVYDLLTETNPCDLDGPEPGSENFLLYEDLDAYEETANPALAAHLRYGTDGTFTLTTHPAPTFAIAAAWLVDRGADPGAFLHRAGHGGAPADERSATVAARFISDHARYEQVEHGVEPGETWVMLRDTTSAGAARPFLLQLEAGDPERGYTLRQGAFANPQEVQQWLETRRTPLPPVAQGEVTVVYSPQALAARTRTTPVAAKGTTAEATPVAVPVPAGRRAVR
ncbi:hypothetical protein ABH931_005815 [Streptacidiphilus sp. MAP12-33]|uniref:hypothetical protein n=1 Tax=Streptacidiphilus sp. MAP12-33 TaxID=3156266 RepID=UPI0035146889